MDFKEKYNGYLEDFDRTLKLFCDNLDCRPQILCDSLKYSLDSGGKRVRPVLALAVSDMLGVDKRKVSNFALAIELKIGRASCRERV